jgi:predicted peroxiredoxin
MKTVGSIFLGFVLATLLLPAMAQSPQTPAPREPGLFVNLTTDDTWAVSKAIYFAHDKVLKSDHGPVTIWLNVRGVTLADRNVPSHTHGLTGKSVHQALQDFIADGGTVIACRACAQAAGITEDDLIDGVVMGQTDMVLDALLQQNVRTLTW